MKKILITGASGLLGANIVETTPKTYKVYGVYNKNIIKFNNCNLIKINITNYKQVKLINKIKPSLVIHCAAFTDVDGCEKNPDFAYQTNVVGTENIVKVTEETGSFLIHISTDSVYDGKKGNYSENDKTNPINVYGKTKLEAEKIVKKSNTEYCIVRTNIYGWNKRNKFSIAEWMIDKLEKNEKLNAFNDVIFTPILVNNLSRALFEIFESNIHGILNVSGSESKSKFEFAETIADVFNLNKSLILSSSINDINLIAKRGKNLSLNTQKAQSLIDTKLLNIKEGLKEMKKLKDDGYVKKMKDQ